MAIFNSYVSLPEGIMNNGDSFVFCMRLNDDFMGFDLPNDFPMKNDDLVGFCFENLWLNGFHWVLMT